MNEIEHSSTIYQVRVWGKTLRVVHYKSSFELGGADDLILHLPQGHTNDTCLKCDTKLVTIPIHTSEIDCRSCGATFSFSGALNPQVINKTRLEVETAIRRMRDE